MNERYDLSKLNDKELTDLEKEIGKAKFNILMNKGSVVFNRYTFAELLKLAQDGRSIEEWKEDSGISPAYLSRALQGLVLGPPSIDIIVRVVYSSRGKVTRDMIERMELEYPSDADLENTSEFFKTDITAFSTVQKAVIEVAKREGVYLLPYINPSMSVDEIYSVFYNIQPQSV